MYTTDPIADMLTRVRNAQLRGYESVEVPATKMLVSIAQILQKEGLIAAQEVLEQEGSKKIVLSLRYLGQGNNKQSVIRSLKRISKPGVRRYVGYREIKNIKNGQGISIITTPQGIMTGKDAVAKKLGGEIICEIW